MYIEPNSNITIYNNVPLDNTYTHTIWFDTPEAQFNYFNSKVVATFNNQTYQRVERGRMRVQISADTIYNCNYLSFKNTSFGNKRFYAFITSVEYINNITAEITFELDVMQTYLFDVTLLDSFVEREHSDTDNVGDNIVPEDFVIGERFEKLMGRTNLFDYSNMSVVVLCPYGVNVNNYPIKPSGEITDPYPFTFVSHNPMQLNAICFYEPSTEDSISRAMIFLSGINKGHDDTNIESVMAVYLVPNSFLDIYARNGLLNRPHSEYPHQGVILPSTRFNPALAYHITNVPQTLGDYRGKNGHNVDNKKLLTAPYNKLIVTDNSGNIKDFAFEFFNHENRNDIEFAIKGTMTPNVTYSLYPYDYKGVENPNFNERMDMGDFPQIAFVNDSYKTWLAQNKIQIALNSLATLTNIGTETKIANLSSFRFGNVFPSLANNARVKNTLVKDISSNVATLEQAKLMPIKTIGDTNGNLLSALEIKDFYFYQSFLNPSDAKIIDDYFSMFGYATKVIKVPNRNVRPHWTYTKTIGCIVEGNAPMEYINKICSIYDDGITFWKNGNEVGNYSLDNSI